MFLPSEIELLIVAVVLYVFDSTSLLYADEGIMTVDGKGTWRAVVGSDEILFLGRSIYVANLLRPQDPAFKLKWKFDETLERDTSSSWIEAAESIRSLAPFSVAAGVALYLLLPLGMLTRLGAPVVILAVTLLYTNIILALCYLYRLRSTIHLQGKQFAALAFECVACPPFAVNLVRRVSALSDVSEPFPVAAQRLLNAEAWGAVRRVCSERIVREIDDEPEGSPRLPALLAQQRRLGLKEPDGDQ